jgi:drug/metabolite transporter (DMT)-like permease
MPHALPQRTAAFQALFVTFLWSTSWVLIKVGLEDLPALTFAGLRYALAAALLLPFALRAGAVERLRHLPRSRWRELVLLGLVLYTLTQGAQFLALAYLPAATASLVLSFSPLLVAVAATLTLREPLSARQWLGVATALAGALVYFAPAAPAGQRLGLLVAGVGLAANAAASVLGRAVNRRGDLPPLLITAVTMSVGAVALLGLGLATQGMPRLTGWSLAIVAWLAVVNTAAAFTLWNRTLRHLSATESSAINNTMLVQIALLALVFLGERLAPWQWLGIALVALGTLAVQLRPRSSPRPSPRS